MSGYVPIFAGDRDPGRRLGLDRGNDLAEIDVTQDRIEREQSESEDQQAERHADPVPAESGNALRGARHVRLRLAVRSVPADTRSSS